MCFKLAYNFRIKESPFLAGFLCPVHTPDGAPCGLLNHLTATCEVAVNSMSIAVNNLVQVLSDWTFSGLKIYHVHFDYTINAYQMIPTN